jgi:hypothetical protein
MKEFKWRPAPNLSVLDGVNMACLKQLEDIGIVGALNWGDEAFDVCVAPIDPKGHENVFLLEGTDPERGFVR